MLKFWGVIEIIVGLIERVVNRPTLQVEDKDAAKKAAEKWARERPRPL